MPGAAERELRRRIRSIQSIKKITKAMELISASRIRTSQARVAAARPYSEQISAVIANLAQAGASLEHPLLSPREEVRKVAYVVLSADRGLAGGYNGTVIRMAERALQADVRQGRDYSLTLIGKKANDYFRFRKYRIDETFTGFTEKPAYEDARAVAQAITRRFEDGEIDQVELVYTRFLSVGTQRATTIRLLPVATELLTDATPREGPQADYEFEPEPGEILTAIVPRYVEARVFAAMLDAAASEHAARQRAMKAATDNAEELIKSLGIKMNRARQDAITSELIEITSGAEALAAAASGSVDLLRDVVPSRDLLGTERATPTRRTDQERRS